MNIDFKKFLEDVGVTEEEYFKINPSIKYLIDNYSITSIGNDSVNSTVTINDNTKLFILKDGTAVSEDEAIEKVTNNYAFINSIINPSDKIITASISRYPSSIRFLSMDKESLYAKLAVTQDYTALKHIKNQTSEIIDFAMDINPDALFYAQDEFKTFDRGLRVLLEGQNAHLFLLNEKSSTLIDYLLNTDVQEKLLQEVTTLKRVPYLFNRRNLALVENIEELKGFLQSYEEKSR